MIARRPADDSASRAHHSDQDQFGTDRNEKAAATSAESAEQHSQLSPFVHRVLIAVGIASVVVLLLLVLWAVAYVLLLAFAGILLAVFLRALTDGVRRISGFSDSWSFGIVLTGLIAVISALVWFLFPQVASQVDELRTTLPQALRELTEELRQYEWGQALLEDVLASDRLVPSRPSVAAGAATVLSQATTIIGGVFIVLFIGLYVAASPRMYYEGFVRLVPPHRRHRAREMLGAVNHVLKWWLIGRAISMVFVGACTAAGLWALGVPLFLALGIVAAFLDFVPNIGPVIAAAPAILLALVDSPTTAIYVTLLYLAVQSAEGYVVTPLIQQKTVSLPPAITVVAQVLFFVLLGPLGLLLASPLAAAAMVVVKGLYVHDALGDREVTMLGNDQPQHQQHRDAEPDDQKEKQQAEQQKHNKEEEQHEKPQSR